jgi:hypothetical protein
MIAFDGQDVTEAGWTFSGACGSVLGHLARVAACRSPKGPTFCFLDADLAQKGPTSPSEGPDVSFLAHNYDIFSI